MSNIRLTWTDNSTGETGFSIERSSDGVSYSEIAVKGANVTSHTDYGLSAGTYYYRLRAFKGGHYSAYSSVASVTVSSTIDSTTITIDTTLITIDAG